MSLPSAPQRMPGPRHPVPSLSTSLSLAPSLDWGCFLLVGRERPTTATWGHVPASALQPPAHPHPPLLA